MPVTFKLGLRNTHREPAHAVCSVHCSSSEFSNLAEDMPISEDDIVGEDVRWDLPDLTVMMTVSHLYYSVCRTTAKQRFAVPLGVRAVQKMLIDTLAAFTTTDKDGT